LGSAYPSYVFSTPDGVYECVDIQNFNAKFIESIKIGDLQPDLDKIDELKKLAEDSNPVIFYYSYE
jgi:hypothetical protein